MTNGTVNEELPPPKSMDSRDDMDDDLTVSDHVRVVVRCRPLQSHEDYTPEILSIKEEQNVIEVSCPNVPLKVYRFNCVADSEKDQNFMFKCTGKPIVECALSGFNGAIVAYGQTGSGKTFTMQGTSLEKHNSDASSKGVIQLVCETIFGHICESSNTGQAVKFSISASYLEIYNESLIDLLSGFSIPGKKVQNPASPHGSNNMNQPKLTIREDSKGCISVFGLSHFEVNSPEECYLLLKVGADKRTVGATKMNMESSRSHAVFTLSISKRSINDGVVHTSRLHLVDLAGSERQKGTGATGIRLREAGGINKSLSALGNVINALSARECAPSGVRGTNLSARMPSWRDSKLTFLLKDALGGNAKLCLIATISPALTSIEETVSTLEFARRCSAVRNEAVVNESLTEDVTELQREVRKLQKSLKNVQMSLSQSKASEAELRVMCQNTGKGLCSRVYSLTPTTNENNILRKHIGTQFDGEGSFNYDGSVPRQNPEKVESSYPNDNHSTKIKHLPHESLRQPETPNGGVITSSVGRENMSDRPACNKEDMKIVRKVHKTSDDNEDIEGTWVGQVEDDANVKSMKRKWKEMIDTNNRLWATLMDREKELMELKETALDQLPDYTNRRMRQELELLRVRVDHNPEILILRHRLEAYESAFKQLPLSPISPSVNIMDEQAKIHGFEYKKGGNQNGVQLCVLSEPKNSLHCSESIGNPNWLRSGTSIAQRLRSGSLRKTGAVKSVSFADVMEPDSPCRAPKNQEIPSKLDNGNKVERLLKKRDAIKVSPENIEENQNTNRGILRRTVTKRRERLHPEETQILDGKERTASILKKEIGTLIAPSCAKEVAKKKDNRSSGEPKKVTGLQRSNSPVPTHEHMVRENQKLNIAHDEDGLKMIKGKHDGNRRPGCGTESFDYSADDRWIHHKNDKSTGAEGQRHISIQGGMRDITNDRDEHESNWNRELDNTINSVEANGGPVQRRLIFSKFSDGLSVVIDDLKESMNDLEEL